MNKIQEDKEFNELCVARIKDVYAMSPEQIREELHLIKRGDNNVSYF